MIPKNVYILQWAMGPIETYRFITDNGQFSLELCIIDSSYMLQYLSNYFTVVSGSIDNI